MKKKQTRNATRTQYTENSLAYIIHVHVYIAPKSYNESEALAQGD